MIRYELWLDESGSFENDKMEVRRNMNPSLIGGILFARKQFSDGQGMNLIGEKMIHSNKENKDDVFEKFKTITEKEVTLVEISNDECISVIDSNLTYQNIMAEGLIQIITKLCEINGNHNFEIKILIAQRGDCTNENKNSKVVSVQQYKDRIKERMILEGYEKSIPSDCWEIEIADAKKDQRLMIADIVCNSFLTRNTKFRGEQGDYINSIRDDNRKTWKFSVFETSLTNSIKRLLLDGRFGEAVICLCQSTNCDFIEHKFDELTEYMKKMGYDDMHLQFQIVSSRIAYYVKIERKYDNCLALLDKMLQYWIPCIDSLPQPWAHEIARIIQLDLLIHEYTIYTHQGDLTNTQICEEKCEGLFDSSGKMNVEALEYLLMYTNRKITHRINLFDFDTALEDSNKLVERCEAIKEALSLSEDGIVFEELGKAYGTRAQIYMYKIRNDSSAFEAAKNDVESAIAEFSTESDIQRQKIYLTQIYTDTGRFDEALKILCGKEESLGKWLVNAEKNIFSICAYVRLMAEGKAKDWEKADEMYQELNKTQFVSGLKESQEQAHPMEIIFWKMGMYYAYSTKSQNAALDYYERARECCRTDSLTLSVIGLSIELERYAFSLREKCRQTRKYLKDLKKHQEKLQQDSIPESIRRIFADIDWDKADWRYFYQLSRRITY